MDIVVSNHVGNTKPPCHINKTLREQEELLEIAHSSHSDGHILIREHLPVYTYDPNKGTLENLIRPQARRKDTLFPRNTEVVEIKRGGSITYHGPGQLVFYFIVDIQTLGITSVQFPKRFGEILDSILINTLAHFDIHAHPKPHYLPSQAHGVWTKKNTHEYKIASYGTMLRYGRITQFGCALNVHTDLSYFDYIFPCGIDIQITSMEKTLRTAPRMRDVANVFQGIAVETLDEYTI